MQIIVLGMHRSGTSVVTRLINMMGAYFGPEGSSLGFSSQNPKGFWERRDVLGLDEALLHSAGADWHRVSQFKLENISPTARATFDQGAKELVYRLDANRPWVIKEPRLCLLFPFWRPLLENPVCVLLHRPPLAVAQSLQERNGFPLSLGTALWERYMLDALTASTGLPRVLVSYEAILANPLAEAEELWKQLSNLGVTGLRRLTRREVEAFVETKNSKTRQNEGKNAWLLPPAQQQLAQALKDGTAIEFVEVPPLSSVAQQYLNLNDDMLSHQDRIETLQHGNRQLREEIETTRDLVHKRANEVQTLRRELEAANFDPPVLQERTDDLDGHPADDDVAKDDVDCDTEIVVCVHNAFLDVRRCLKSLLEYTKVPYRLIIVNDGSESRTSGYLKEFALLHQHVTLLESAEATGYTRAANRGLKASRANLIVLLNSDTIVTESWFEGLKECFESSEHIGIVGPLSNAASYQSVPERFSQAGDWEINQLPPGWNIEKMARLVAAVSRRRFPRVPFVNGFCFAIRRSVIEAIGYLDEETFPRGYGEENDYCLRAAEVGFELAIADHVYVHHAMSKSYSHETRLELSKDARAAIEAKHDHDQIRRKVEELRAQPDLEAARQKIAQALSLTQVEVAGRLEILKVLFLLPVKGGGGGVHSIVQEVSGMRQLGCDARVAVPLEHLGKYHNSYPSLAPELFLGYTDHKLVETVRHFHVAVATIFTAVRRLVPIEQTHPDILLTYYIQDYEPWIVDQGSAYEQEALASYTLIPNMACFAKTEWLCRTAGSRHGIEVHKVKPSLDTSVYYPLSRPPEDADGVRVAAMVRPKTPYRGPKVTMEILSTVSRKLGRRIRPILFGCESQDPEFLALEHDFEFENRGVLRREEVGELLRSSHIFVDFSTYQAFGRTALEAMACGCSVIVPKRGGTSEYAIDRVNALVVDTTSDQSMEEALTELILNSDLRRQLAREGLNTASGYDIHRAAWSELSMFRQALARKRSGTVVA